MIELCFCRSLLLIFFISSALSGFLTISVASANSFSFLKSSKSTGIMTIFFSRTSSWECSPTSLTTMSNLSMSSLPGLDWTMALTGPGCDDLPIPGLMIGHFKWPLLVPELDSQNRSSGRRNNREKAAPSGFKLWNLSIIQLSLSKIFLYNFMLKFLLVPARRQYL